jgi:hypothetical protein
MARRPNYRFERFERERKKAARREERAAAKAERRDRKHSPEAGESAPVEASPEASAGPVMAASPNAPEPAADPSAIDRLAQALSFVCGAEHPTTLAVRRAAASGGADDIGRARAMFLQLPARDRQAALAIAGDAEPPAS